MRTFSARETVWLRELDGIELASFPRRAIAFVIDLIIISALMSALISGLLFGYLKVLAARGQPTPDKIHLVIAPGHASMESSDGKLQKHGHDELAHLIFDIAIPVLYFGLLTWRGNGRSPGKRVTKIRVVSLVHHHLTLWHSVERALGYGAAALEAGFGFAQFFIHPYRRCVQDRIAETIVVTERSYQAFQHRRNNALKPDAADESPDEIAAETVQEALNISSSM